MAHGFDERVDCPAVFEVAAKTDRHAVQRSFFVIQRHHVRERLRRVKMSAVACIDDGRCGIQRRCLGSTLHRMADGDDVGIAADNGDRILEAFALGNRGILRIIKSDHTAAQPQHCRFEGHLGSGGRLVKQRC